MTREKDVYSEFGMNRTRYSIANSPILLGLGNLWKEIRSVLKRCTVNMNFFRLNGPTTEKWMLSKLSSYSVVEVLGKIRNSLNHVFPFPWLAFRWEQPEWVIISCSLKNEDYLLSLSPIVLLSWKMKVPRKKKGEKKVDVFSTIIHWWLYVFFN